MFNSLKKLNRAECNKIYLEVVQSEDATAARDLCLNDLFFLLTIGCKRADANRDWIFDRCRELEADDDDILDLWSREHYKSTLKTFAKNIQRILRNPEVTIGIFSHTRPIAKAFLAQIKREFEINTFLQNLFPEILYKDPKKESSKWSLDEGIIVKRKGNPKESTVEAHGLVDGQPTSKHFDILNYDDVVTRESVTTTDMIKKVTDAWALSLNLGSEGGKRVYCGTRYHQNDTYATMMARGAVRPRIYPATDDGTFKGKPVLWDQEYFDNKVRDMGSYVASCQLLQNALADKAMGFKEEWLEFYDVLRNSRKWNYYVLVDPASEKKKDSDYTAIAVVGLAPDGNYYLVDGCRDRLNLTERTDKVFHFVRTWKPVAVGYEKYGHSSDIEHIRYVQQQEGYRFNVVQLAGGMPKNDRIRRLVPLFENHKFYFPRRLTFINYEGKVVDLIRDVIDYEYIPFPVSTHDDFLDCLSRICDPELRARFPKISEKHPLNFVERKKEERYDPLKINNGQAVQMHELKTSQTKSWKDIMSGQ